MTNDMHKLHLLRGSLALALHSVDVVSNAFADKILGCDLNASHLFRCSPALSSNSGDQARIAFADFGLRP